MSLFTLVGCNKSVIQSAEFLSSVQENQVNQILQMNTGEARLAFNLLDNETKLAFTKRKLQIISNHTSLNKVQKALVNEVASSLTIKMYEDGPEKIKFKTTADILLNKLNKSFTREEIIAYFFDIGKTAFRSTDTGNLVVLLADQPPSYGGDCHCHIGSDFAFCSNGCNYTYGCNRSNSGCGFMFVWECNGKC